MATKNTINNASGDLTVDPGASGDSFVQFNINATGEFRIGVDDDASDAFKISQGSALGTNDTFVVTASGEITTPLQPAFFAYSGTNLNVTGDGTIYTVAFNSEAYDIGSNYDTTTYTFTAPIDGRYRLIGNPWASQLTGSFTSQYVQLVTSNRTYKGVVCDGNSRAASASQSSNPISVLADMDASDTCTLTFTVSGSGKTVDVGSVSLGDMRGFFAGSLTC